VGAKDVFAVAHKVVQTAHQGTVAQAKGNPPQLLDQMHLTKASLGAIHGKAGPTHGLAADRPAGPQEPIISWASENSILPDENQRH
jgi:hypothetical protein